VTNIHFLFIMLFQAFSKAMFQAQLRPGHARSFKPKLLANGNGAFPSAAAALDGNTLIAFSYCQVFTFLASLLFTQPITLHISFL
jgi:hypothetical protein